MYRFLDRRVSALDPTHRFLLVAMRLWAGAARGAGSVTDAFAAVGATETLGDFGIAMATLEHDSGWMLRLAAIAHDVVLDDEARLLALFDAGLSGQSRDVRRRAAALVADDAASRLALAVERVAMTIGDNVFVERDR